MGSKRLSILVLIFLLNKTASIWKTISLALVLALNLSENMKHANFEWEWINNCIVSEIFDSM